MVLSLMPRLSNTDMKDYSELGFGSRMVKETSRAGTREYVNVLEENLKIESTPYLNRTAIGKGTVQTISGGLTELVSTEGGTVLFTVNPDTGTVTIAGPLQANVTLNLGTINNTTIAGAGTHSGTLINQKLISGGTYQNGTINNPVIGTPAVSGGTLNPTVYQTQGSAGSAGSIIYVKTVDFVGSAVTLGTLNFSNGINLTFS